MVGTEADDAYLSNAHSFHLFGLPRVGAQQMLHWIAAWTRATGRRSASPPTSKSATGKC